MTAKQFKRTVQQRGIAEILAMPLTTEAQADAFLVEMKELNWGLVLNQQTLAAPLFAEWEVAGYLQRQENQRKDGWPEVLGVWCRAYTDLLSANMMLNCLADPKTLDRLLGETHESNSRSSLPPIARAECHTVLLNLQAVTAMLRQAWESDKEEMLKIVGKVRTPAKERGLYLHLGYWEDGNVLYVSPGDGTSRQLDWKYKKNTEWLNSISVHIPSAQKDSFAPIYDLVTCEHSGLIGRHALDSVTGDLFARADLVSPRKDRGDVFLDVCGIALGDDSGYRDQTTLLAIALKDSGPHPYACINLYTGDGAGKSTRIDWEPHVAATDLIRCLHLPPTGAADDPDADALADAKARPSGAAPLSATRSVIYGGNRGGQRFWVRAANLDATLELPPNWSRYSGIEVDPYYFWIFGVHGIACASHASLIKYLQGKLQQPSWLLHVFDKDRGQPVVDSLSVSADGTLFAAMQGGLYSGDYAIDHGKRRMVTSGWVERGGQAKQVVKMAIPCWTVLESLAARLQTA